VSERGGPSLAGRVPGGLWVVVPALVVLGLLWFLRPWLQGLVYAVYTTPALVLPLAAAAVPFLAFGRDTSTSTINAAGTLFVVTLVVTSGATGLFAGETLGTATLDGAETATGLDESDPANPRVVTRQVASRYASNTLNFPQYRVTNSDVTVYNGSVYWSYALSPDGLWNHFTKRQHGTVLVDMAEQNADVRTITGDMAAGMGTAFYNNHRWRTLKQGQYLVNYHDSFMVVHEGEQYIATPYTSPEFHWLPVPYTTPTWGGVALVDSDGTVRDLTPEEAQNSEVLAGQRLYPFSLARDRVAATKYRNGIVNTFTSHEGEIEVAPVPGEGNDQPFYLQTEDGPKYVVAVEPYGEAQGLREVWTVDARTGAHERYSPNASLFGPRKATDYVRQAARTTDWNRFQPSEPIPVVVDGQLYWEVRVVPEDGSGISYVAFVNARTSDVTEVETTPQVRQFMRGEPPTETEPRPADGDEPALIVRRVAPNGTVLDEMAVYGNESVSVVSGNGSDAVAPRGGDD